MAWLGVGSTLLLTAAVVARTSDPPPSFAAPAGDGTAATANASPDPGAGTTAAAGARAYIDPSTGKLSASPSRSELQRLALQQRSLQGPAIATSRSMVGLKPFALAHGGRGVNLQGRFQTAMRVERAADGSFHLTCGDVHSGEDASASAGSSVGGAASAGSANSASIAASSASLQSREAPLQ
jgi:hypothetical protein